MFILHRVSRSKGLSCFMQFGKECNYFKVTCLFFWQFITNKRRSCSQDWIIWFFIIVLLTYLIPYSVFCFMLFFLLQQDFVKCRYSAHLKILKTKVNMTATGFEPRRSIIIRVANLLGRVYRALQNINYCEHRINYFNINTIQSLKRDNFSICHFWPK